MAIDVDGTFWGPIIDAHGVAHYRYRRAIERGGHLGYEYRDPVSFGGPPGLLGSIPDPDPRIVSRAWSAWPARDPVTGAYVDHLIGDWMPTLWFSDLVGDLAHFQKQVGYDLSGWCNLIFTHDVTFTDNYGGSWLPGSWVTGQIAVLVPLFVFNRSVQVRENTAFYYGDGV